MQETRILLQGVGGYGGGGTSQHILTFKKGSFLFNKA